MAMLLGPQEAAPIMAAIELGPIRDLAPRIPITRRVGVGRPPASEGKGPTKLDHFEITASFQNNAFARDEEAHKVVGPQPKRLNVVLLSDDPNDSLVVRHQLWIGARMACEGNGEQAIRGRGLDGKVVECHASRDRWPQRAAVEVAQLKKAAQDKLPPTEKTKRLPVLEQSLAMDDPSKPVQCFFAQIDGGCKVTSSLIFEIEGLPGLARFRSHGVNTGRELLSSMALVVKWVRVATPDGKAQAAPIVHLEARAFGSLKAAAAEEISRRRGLEARILEDRKLLQAVQAEQDPEAVAAEFVGVRAEDVVAAAVQAEEKPSGGMR